MKEIRLEGLTEFLQTPKSIIVTSHVNPDGDAIGSALGLAMALKKMAHTVKVIVPNDYPSFLKWLPGSENLIIAEQNPEDAKALINAAEVVFHLDYNAMNRAAQLAPLFEASAAVKVLIDHHRQPESWPNYIYSDTAMSSTCQMVYEWLDMNNWLHLLDLDIAQCLYTGLVTDTGSFRFAITTSRTLQIASHLLQLGVAPDVIYNRIFDSNSISRLRLLGSMLDNLEYFKHEKAVLLHLKKEELTKNHYQKGDSEGFVNYGLSIGGVQFSVFLREDVDSVKVSLRSKGDLDVNDIARKFFNGGGHVNAAGGSLDISLDEAKKLARNVILNHLKG